MTNYIEIRHQYTDRHQDVNVDTWWAVKPTSHDWNPAEGPALDLGPEAWRISPGETIHIYGLEDLAGLRKLLDRIEQEIEKEGNSG